MTSEQRDYEKGWGFCEVCRGRRPASALTLDREGRWRCASDWAGCVITAARLRAREEVDKLNPEPEGYAQQLAAELAPVESKEDRARRLNRERQRRFERNRRPRERDRAKALAQRQAQHRKERES